MSGQASAEYVGVIALVAIVLAAGGAVAAPAIPAQVGHQIRVGLCIVGGDVCRAADARAEGLRPCVTRVRQADRRTKVSVTVVSYTTGAAFGIERRSDGSARVWLTSSDGGGVTVGGGLKLGPYVDVGGEAGAGVGWTSGGAWELPDERALLRFLGGVRQQPGAIAWDLLRDPRTPRPTETFHAVTGEAAAEAGAKVLGLRQPVALAGGKGALGKRTRGRATSWYFDAGSEGPRLFGGLIPGVELRRAGAWVLELSDRPHELRLTTQLPKGVELDARLDLDDPANAAVARELLSRPGPGRARALGAHFLAHGTVERRTYRTRALPSEPEIGIALGVGGFDHGGSAHEKSLVAAEVLGPSGNRRRADCLGL
jgi:hypothetical protein